MFDSDIVLDEDQNAMSDIVANIGQTFLDSLELYLTQLAHNKKGAAK